MSAIHWESLTKDERVELLRRPPTTLDPRLRERAEEIVSRVRTGGDEALRQLTKQLDGVDLESFRITDDEFENAAAELSQSAIAAIDVAIANVRRFHLAQQSKPIDMETLPGIRCERIYQPLDAVGLYVPAGTAPLPSAAIMLAVPAAIASCPTRILCTPPKKNGLADSAVITAALRSGVTEIYKVGGAQAIAAMAYGTQSIPRVDRIFGPGNAWVTAAKAIVSSDVDGTAVDMPAGPSEVLVIADEQANPEFVASDLLSQAEHGTDSQVVLITNSAQLAERVARAVDTQLGKLPRKEIASQALKHSRMILVDSIETAVAISNRYAPEHLILQVEEPRSFLPRVRNAGSVFLGRWSPEAAGDYCTGTNHVLPTYGFARSYSGLGVEQFMRCMSVQELSEQGLRSIAPTIVELAGLEGLHAHANAVSLRLDPSASSVRR